MLPLVSVPGRKRDVKDSPSFPPGEEATTHPATRAARSPHPPRLCPVRYDTVPQARPHPSPPFHLQFVHPRSGDVTESQDHLADCSQGTVTWIRGSEQ